MKPKVLGYWSSTILLAFALLSGGAAEIVRQRGTIEGMVHLGYPGYFVMIIGFWKVLGAITLLAPGLLLLKEWAYAGVFFNMTGAAVSHAVCGDPGWHVIVTLSFVLLAVASWVLRPSTRRLDLATSQDLNKKDTMLCVNKYKKDYIDECRARMESLATAARAEKRALNSAVDAFEPLFFNNLSLVLDNYFVHRSRTMEGKDGNPLDEFRMICTLLLQNQGVMCTDKTNNTTIKYNPEKSVLKLQVEAPIKLSESDSLRLFRAFFAGIESKFGERKGWAGRQGAGANNP